MRAIINGLFSGVWADDNFGSSTTLRIQSKGAFLDVHRDRGERADSVTLALTDHLGGLAPTAIGK